MIHASEIPARLEAARRRWLAEREYCHELVRAWLIQFGVAPDSLSTITSIGSGRLDYCVADGRVLYICPKHPLTLRAVAVIDGDWRPGKPLKSLTDFYALPQTQRIHKKPHEEKEPIPPASSDTAAR